MDAVNTLIKALEAGSYEGAPSTLTQGSALQTEDLSPVMNNVTFSRADIKLTKMIKKVDCKSITAQFNRQLSYGTFGGSARSEGFIGQEDTSDYVRITVPMCFYSSIRTVSIASTMVATFDGKGSEDREAESAAIKLSSDIEFDLFRGMDDFSNAGVFDANPHAVADLPNIHGLGLQVRQSDSQVNSQDAMFAEFGNNESVVLSGGGTTLTQDKIEDASVRANVNFGTPDKFLTDPMVLSAYNKISFNMQRIILAGSPQGATGADLSRQWVSGGTVTLEGSHFLQGKFRPRRPRQDSNAPAAPSISATNSSGGALGAGAYIYYVTGENEIGESPASATSTATASANDKIVVTITHSGSGGAARFFNVYRSAAGGTAASAKFIGRVLLSAGASTTDFTDLGNKVGAFVTGYLTQGDTMEARELAPYSRIGLAVTQLHKPEGHFTFTTLAVTQPRKNVLIDNLKGSL
jgi:hypothetical protein